MRLRVYAHALGPVLIAWLLSALEVHAQLPPPQPTAKAPPVLNFSLLEDKVAAGEVKVYLGHPVTKAEAWRSVIVATINGGPRSCTATLVGFRVVLTAAHCLDTNMGFATLATVAADGPAWNLQCEHHPGYPETGPYLGDTPRSGTDYALCWVKAPPVLSGRLKDLEYDVVSLEPVSAGDPLLLSGYGCTGMTPRSDGGIDVLYSKTAFNIAESSVDKIKQGTDAAIETRSPKGTQPALCKGDSGGPAFSDPDGKRRIRGVNSSVETEGVPPNFTFLSRIAPVAANGFEAWAKTWLAEIAHTSGWICGISPGHAGGSAGCRD